MKTSVFFLAVFGLALMRVVECAPPHDLLLKAPILLRHSCPRDCKGQYDPICAIDEEGKSKNFDSKCHMEATYCEGKNYVILTEHPC